VTLVLLNASDDMGGSGLAASGSLQLLTTEHTWQDSSSYLINTDHSGNVQIKG
jgi:hypothetical protein